MSGSINLDVQDFDCHNQMMTADLRKTLKVKTFPKLSIRFISLSKFPVQGDACAIKGSVAIVLAGVTKIVDVDYQVRPQGGKAFVLLGTRSINFSDFNLVPPRKIGGMIQTRNELSVAFTLNLKILE